MTVAYRHTGLVLLRASTDPGDLPVPGLDLLDPAAVEGEGLAWVTRLWQRRDVREALELASPALSGTLERLCHPAAGPRKPKDVRRAVTAVASYMLRWRRRATPFGVFAGVGVADIGPAAAKVGRDHRAVAHADADWLATLVDKLDRRVDLRVRLTVMADNARTVRDGRVYVPRRAPAGAATAGSLVESSVRLTAPVELALDLAGAPIRFTVLAAALADRLPSASRPRIYLLLHNLVDAGLLITGLHSPMTTVDPLSHLVETLRAAGAGELAQLDGLLGELGQIRTDLERHNTAADPRQAATLRAGVVDRMCGLADTGSSVVRVDTRLDATVTVPESVLVEAAAAAGVLLRLSTRPFGSSAWLDYHARFRARYGPGALVPVRDLLADSGLGYPSGYLNAPRARPTWRMVTQRDAALLALIQQATIEGAEEIRLTDADVAALTVGDHDEVVASSRAELGVAIRARSTKEIDTGRFRLWITAAPSVPSSMAGRFAYLLGEADQARLAVSCTADEASGGMPVQLSFPPRRRHNENVVRVPPLIADVMSLSEHPDSTHPEARVVGVDDLAVTADDAQMYLVQISTGRRIAPVVPHALDTQVQTPPLARFLAEVADARNAVFGGVDLGAARTLPYIPRIRYRRTVLVAARWLLTRADLTREQSSEQVAAAVASWRRRWRVPARVVLCEGELRLPLDLDQPLDRALLHQQVRRTDRVEIHEDATAQDEGWIGRPAELLIPLVLATPSPRPLPVTAAPGRLLPPGASTILHAQMIGNPARFDDLLTTHLPRLVHDLDGLVRGWWARRRRSMIQPDTDHSLAVFLRLRAPDDYGPVAAAVAEFATDLQARGLPGELTLASYAQHPARYGDGPAAAAAEQVFETDTAAAIAQILAVTRNQSLSGQALAAASMAHLAAAFATSSEAGFRMLVDAVPVERGPVDRGVRDDALRLADPNNDYLRALAGGEAVAVAWTRRAAALRAYHDALAVQRDPAAVVRTLLHEHHLRALGVDPAFETMTCRLARAVAQRCLALSRSRAS